MGNKCISNVNNPIILDNQQATCYIYFVSEHYLIYFPTLTEAYKFSESFIDSPIFTSSPRVGSMVFSKTSYPDVCSILEKDKNEIVRVDDDAFIKISVYLTNTIHESLKKNNPSIENPYSLLYKLNKL